MAREEDCRPSPSPSSSAEQYTPPASYKAQVLEVKRRQDGLYGARRVIAVILITVWCALHVLQLSRLDDPLPPKSLLLSLRVLYTLIVGWQGTRAVS